MFRAVVVAGAVMVALVGCGGSPDVLSDAEVESGLAAYADEINSPDGLRFDDFSRLTSAMAMNKVISIRGDSILDMADISDSYHSSRIDQATNVLCTDDTLRELLRARATVHFNWYSNDDESIGDMITFRGDEACSIFES